MAPQPARTVKVYDKKNNEYTVSHLNAHDMVVHLGYTYKPGKTYLPTDVAPHAGMSAPKGEAAQEVLDSVGRNPLRQAPQAVVLPTDEQDAEAEAAEELEAVEAVELVIEPQPQDEPEPEVVLPTTEPETETEVEAAAPRRGRPKK